MECTNCGHLNADDAHFCENCGNPLQRSCPNCGQAVSPSARFCKNCGYNLARGTVTPLPSPAMSASPLHALRQAAPQSVASKIIAQRERMEGERKRVTTLFTDIVGSTSLAEQMDPEDWREVVAGAHRLVSNAVYRYEGTIAQLLGDGVLAFFGAPLAHEDDAERAVRAALAILEGLEDYAEELERARRVNDFQLRIGINTGLVVVGNIGHDLHMEYLAIGDTVNLAARVQTAADPNTIFVSDNSYRLVQNLFDFENKGKLTLKGKGEPVQVYRVLGERLGAVRIRGIAGLSSPLVGRDREYGALLELLERLDGGQGALVAVIGEAGLGKSRLIAEWRKAGHERFGEHLRWVEGRCLSYGSSMPHHLTADILRGLAAVRAEASESEVAEALAAALKDTLGDAANEVYPFLGHLLNLHLDAEAAARLRFLEGPALQAQYVASLRRFLRGLAAKQPLIITLEDVHWADPSSAELLTQVLSVAAEAPLIVAVVARPERDAPGWRLVDGARQSSVATSLELVLTPLTGDDSCELVGNLLEVSNLPDAVRDVILQKAEGNPFFVEEVIRMLIDRGGITRDPETGAWTDSGVIEGIEIPDTLQGVLAARIDRLPEDAKRMLQVASVIGRKFQVSVLQHVLREEGA